MNNKEKRRKRVLIIASEYASGMIPFAATIINTLSKDNRFVVKCLCVNSGMKTYRTVVDEGVDASFVEYPQNKLLKCIYKFWPFKTIRCINRLKKEFKPDVIHFLTGDFTLARYVCIYNSPNYYYTVHDFIPHGGRTVSICDLRVLGVKKYLELKTTHKGVKLLRDSIKNLTTCSNVQLEDLRKEYPRKKIQLSPFPSLITNAIMKGQQEVVELKGCADYVLFFGAVETYKGVELLIEAFKDFENSGKKLVIAGKGKDFVNLPNNIIRLNRFIHDEELYDLFSKASCIAYPYLSATMSGVLSLAFYFNKHVLLSDVSYFKQYDAPCCTFFKAGDIEDLRKKLHEILNAKSLTVDTNAYLNYYSEEQMLKQYHILYE